MWNGWHGWWPMGWFMWLFWLALVVVIVWLVVRASAGSSPQDTPEQIVKRRYARGELSREEYDRLLSDLRR